MGIFSALGSAFSGVSKSISHIASGAARSASRTVSSASRTVSRTTGNAAKAASSTASNFSRAVAAVTQSAGKSATGFATSSAKSISHIAGTAARTAASTAGTITKAAAANPIKTAATLAGGAGIAAVSISTLLNNKSSDTSNKSGTSTIAIPAATTANSDKFPDFSIDGVYNRIKNVWDSEAGSAESAAVFMGEGREGNSEVSFRDVIANTLGVGNAGKTLYKTGYSDGAYEIRNYQGVLVSGGSPGAAYALKPVEKRASVNAYQAKNQAEMQALAANGNSAAQAWLKKYSSSDSDMYTATYGKVWAGQTESTTKTLSRQYATGNTGSNENGGILSGILNIFGGSESSKNTGTQNKSSGILGSVSSGYDSLYKTKSSLYDKSSEAFESGNLTKGALAIAPAAAADIIAPLDLMQVGNKIFSGRSGEITQDELIGGGIDAGLLAFGALTGGTGYFAGKALKSGLKAGIATAVLTPAIYAGDNLA
ncbi:MAG: hypothetical protein PHV39_04240, partial [Methanomicrobium sp.]|nr:hypothetical protein [Methanomicrobium sp.]